MECIITIWKFILVQKKNFSITWLKTNPGYFLSARAILPMLNQPIINSACHSVLFQSTFPLLPEPPRAGGPQPLSIQIPFRPLDVRLFSTPRFRFNSQTRRFQWKHIHISLVMSVAAVYMHKTRSQGFTYADFSHRDFYTFAFARARAIIKRINPFRVRASDALRYNCWIWALC